jgi:hypothetical protein
MSDAQTKAKRTKTADERDVWSPDLPARDKIRPRLRIVPLMITLTTVALAVPLGWAMWVQEILAEALNMVICPLRQKPSAPR